MEERRSNFTVASRPLDFSNMRIAGGESTRMHRNVSNTANANAADAPLTHDSSGLLLVEFASGFEDCRETDRMSSNTWSEIVNYGVGTCRMIAWITSKEDRRPRYCLLGACKRANPCSISRALINKEVNSARIDSPEGGNCQERGNMARKRYIQ